MAGLQKDVYVSAAITWTSAFIALILRVVARRMTKQRWWIDDYFCLAAFAAACAYNAIMIKCKQLSLKQAYMPSLRILNVIQGLPATSSVKSSIHRSMTKLVRRLMLMQDFSCSVRNTVMHSRLHVPNSPSWSSTGDFSNRLLSVLRFKSCSASPLRGLSSGPLWFPFNASQHDTFGISRSKATVPSMKRSFSSLLFLPTA